jgi:MoxR-like ATPase
VRARADHLAGVGVDEAEDDLQQRGLARAVGADDGDALVVPNAQREVAEEVFPTVLLLEVADGDQSGSPLGPLVEMRDCTRVGAGVKAG